MKHRLRTKGFLITQMLVVVAVIGVLAAVVAVNVSEARKKARDTERIHALNQINGALQLYYADHKKYPQGRPYVVGAGMTPDPHGDSRFSYVDPAYGCNVSDPHPSQSPTGTPWNNPDDAQADIAVHATNADGDDANPTADRPLQDFLPTLVQEGYLAQQWYRPSTPNTLRFECKYVTDKDEYYNNNIQGYLLHCNLESGTDVGAGDYSAPLEVSDGGLNDSVYEIYSPGRKRFCPYGNDGMGPGYDLSGNPVWGSYVGG